MEQDVSNMGNEALFKERPVWTAILTLAVPSVLSILVMLLYNMADMFFVGLLHDNVQVAAVACPAQADAGLSKILLFKTVHFLPSFNFAATIVTSNPVNLLFTILGHKKTPVHLACGRPMNRR